MDFALNEDQKMMRDLCRDFATKEIMPRAEEWNKAHEFPKDIFARMAGLGLMGMLVPVEYGGVDVGTIAYVAALEEIARGDQSVASMLNAHSTIGTMPLLSFGTEEQKRKYLVPLAKGERIGSFGLTEPDAGSDARGIKTTSVADGDEWVINGSKCFITNAGTPISYGVVILTVAGGPTEGNRRYNALIVPKDAPGFTVGRQYDKIGWDAADTRELYFDNCRVPRENLLGTEGAGLRQFLEVLDVGRISVATLSLGLGQRALELGLEYAQQRVQFGRPLCKHQAIQFKLADMATQVEMARLITYKAAWLRDNGLPYAKEAAMAKLQASESAVRAAEESLQIHGGYGYAGEYPISRVYRDSKILTIGEGTSEIQRMVIGRALGC